MSDEVKSPFGEKLELVPIPRVQFRESRDPFFTPDTHELETVGAESLLSTANNLDLLWTITTDFQEIDNPKILGEPIEYWLGDRRVFYPGRELNDGQIAIAKFRYLAEQWELQLSKACWQSTQTFPPIDVFRELVAAKFVGVEFAATAILTNEPEPHFAPDFIKQKLADCVSTVEPSIELLFASLRANRTLPPTVVEMQGTAIEIFSPTEKAIAAMMKSPEMSVTDIAKLVGCGKSTLYRNKTFMAARSRQHSPDNIRRGFKSGGVVEAFDDPDDDLDD